MDLRKRKAVEGEPGVQPEGEDVEAVIAANPEQQLFSTRTKMAWIHARLSAIWEFLDQMNPWSDRFDEFVRLLPSGYIIAISKEEWKRKCTGVDWCPPIHY